MPYGRTTRWGESRGLDRMAKLTSSSEVLAGQLESSVVCSKDLKSCTFEGANLFIAASRPVLIDGTARILVESWARGGPHSSRPVDWGSVMYTLVRTGSRWEVSHREIQALS